ncbi:MAG: ABC-F family ATP-binding cassette domain-containing protein [Bacillota bacterium]|nr:ABC-F family ATP-binding cassette domain-containing protein [Bacillota bacterium]
MSIFNVENLTHGFGDKVLFKDVSFRLLKGEKVGLIGANGSGKTTLFNILSGRLLADEGVIKWSHASRIGHLDQHSSLEEGKSIRDTLRDAFRELYKLEEEMQQHSEKLSDSIQDERAMNKILKRIGDIQDKLYSSGFFEIESRIDTMAAGLGIDILGMDTEVNKLSGGQRTKVLLARLLLSSPDLLLLDEPTNYLDAEHVEWLSEYLSSYKNSFMVISHDTGFLNRVVNIIYHLQFTDIKRYPGNYDAFIKLKDEAEKKYITDYYRQQEEIKRLEQFVKSNIVRASTTKRAQSRQKMLDKIDRLEKPKTAPKPYFDFKTCRDPGKLIFESRELDIGYSYPLMRNINLKLTRGDKIALTGCNGIGKTTFLKTVMGMIPGLGGRISYGEYLQPVYYEQEFHYRSGLTPMEEIWNEYPDLTQKEVRKALALCGLKEEQVRQSMSSLSGGEQSKVRLCRLILKPCNWLILDEPTNHLDTAAKESLKESLKDFKGTVLLVCHEQEFYEDWVTEVWNMENLITVTR